MKLSIMPYLRLVAISIVLAIAIGLALALLGLLLGWKTSSEYSNGFFIAGAVTLVIGLLSVVGGYQVRGNFNVLYSQSAGTMNIKEQTDRMVADINQSYGTLIRLGLAGVLLIVTAAVIDGLS